MVLKRRNKMKENTKGDKRKIEGIERAVADEDMGEEGEKGEEMEKMERKVGGKEIEMIEEME